MRLVIVSLFLTAICFLSLSCQQYSTGLQQGSSRADETSAIATLRTIAQAQTTYSITNGGSYGTFAQLVEGGLLDGRFNHDRPESHGYVFTMTMQPAADGKPGSFGCHADPAQTSDYKGGRHFYIEGASQDIHVNPSRPAAATDEVFRP